MNNIISMRHRASHSRSALTQLRSTHSRSAFTLVELLVVIAIIGVLVALLLPAIQAARESARNAQCKNNVKQIAMAMLNFESSNRAFPAGGWGFRWMGDPNQAGGPRQPGGWIYQVAPYIENQAITLIGGGTSGDALMTANVEQCAVAISTFNCPSRRPAVPYQARELLLRNSHPPTMAAKTDYAAAGGQQSITTGPGPSALIPSFTDCKAENGFAGRFPNCDWLIKEGDLVDPVTGKSRWQGIVTDHRGARLADITDGTSNTMLAGEKWVATKFYEIATERPDGQEPGDNPGDNGSMYQGYDFDNVRWPSGSFDGAGKPQGNLPTMDSQDGGQNGDIYKRCFGSAHSAGVNVAMCDGSVDSFGFDVDPLYWNALSSRAGEELINEQ